MPRYKFSCTTCRQTFEKDLLYNGSRAEVRCPSGHRSVHRVYQAPSVVFKGSGWYRTDHRSVGSSLSESSQS
jgi:putative FmdB family regulatory protein